MKRFERVTFLILRLGISALILGYLFYLVDIENAKQAIQNSARHWIYLCTGTLVELICFCLGSLRWKIILDFQGLNMNFRKVFSIYFIGLFFNNLMFGSTGGDLIRAFYAAKTTHHKKAEAVATIITDRLIGLFVMAVTAVIIILITKDFYLSEWETKTAAILMIIMLLSLLTVLLLLFNIKRIKYEHLLNKLSKFPNLTDTIRRLMNAINIMHNNSRLVIKVCALSAAALFLAVSEWYFIGKGFQLNLTFLNYLQFVPLVMCLAAIPISPGGLGVREGLAVVILTAMGITAAKALPLTLIIYLISIFWSLPGGLLFLCSHIHSEKK
jgi:glycosyltransferase 2 family protein